MFQQDPNRGDCIKSSLSLGGQKTRLIYNIFALFVHSSLSLNRKVNMPGMWEGREAELLWKQDVYSIDTSLRRILLSSRTADWVISGLQVWYVACVGIHTTSESRCISLTSRISSQESLKLPSSLRVLVYLATYCLHSTKLGFLLSSNSVL